MDPITALGLIASVLQVVDFSTKALTKCRELYRDGSLAEHRSTEEITKHLVDTSDRLRASVDQTPKPLLHGHSDIVEVSTKCSETAAKLLAELEKLKVDSRGGVRQAISKGVRAIRRKSFMEEVQSELQEYQAILNTRILVELDIHSIQQTNDFQSLDHNVRDLAVALSHGRNTVAQLLADHGQAIRDHMDQRLDAHQETSHDLRLQQQFKDSLFFPSIFSRRDEIPEAHRGTYRWIFQPPRDSRTGGPEREKLRAQKWPNFITWLQDGREIYWLNGKPGSGKSTLMKYIVSELGENNTAKDAIAYWANGTDVVTASFFFWTLGSDILQKDLQGLLRSLLYQIANQREDLVPIMMGRETNSVGRYDKSTLPAQIHAWTEPRLSSTLQRFLLLKPSSISLCFFIDGLDEFVGDEDKLLEVLRLLNDTPQTKVCLSSRPEQIFCQGFSKSPQLRLQDFNHKDIKKAAADNLLPTLKGYFPQEEDAIRCFVHDVVYRAQGVFLWLHLVTKDIKRGARNSDTLRELELRLETIPDTIEGLYEHMLNRLDKIYLREALKYFGFLMLSLSRHSRGLVTFLNFVCAESGPWKYVLNGDLTYFESPDFSDTCHQFETRLLTRCGGLVEIGCQRPTFLRGVYQIRSGGGNGWLAPASQEVRNVSNQFREVKFIHKTVIDFLNKDTKTFFHDSDWRSDARLALIRGHLGVISVIPIAISLAGAGSGAVGHLSISPYIKQTMKLLYTMSNPQAVDEPDQAVDSVVVGMVDNTYEIIERVDASLNGSNIRWFDRYRSSHFGHSSDEPLPFYDSHGFAAFFGCHSYISYHRKPLCDPSSMGMDYILRCTITGMRWDGLRSPDVRGFFSIIHESLRQGADPNLPLTSQSKIQHVTFILNMSAWGTCLNDMIDRMARVGSLQVDENSLSNNGASGYVLPSLRGWITLVEWFVSHDADVNTSIFKRYYTRSTEYTEAMKITHLMEYMIEETPLSAMKRAASGNELSLLPSVTSLFRSRGALERRRLHYICGMNARQLYRVNEEQSDLFFEAWVGGDGDTMEDGESFHAAFLDLEASLTKLEVEKCSTTVLHSSW